MTVNKTKDFKDSFVKYGVAKEGFPSEMNQMVNSTMHSHKSLKKNREIFVFRALLPNLKMNTTYSKYAS